MTPRHAAGKRARKVTVFKDFPVTGKGMVDWSLTNKRHSTDVKKKTQY